MPKAQREGLLRSLYGAFNARDIDTVLAAMTADVDWPNGWEGGRVVGHDNVRDYWERQWAAINPTVEPTALRQRAEEEVEVTVHQVVRNKTGTLLTDSEVQHVYASEAISYSAWTSRHSGRARTQVSLTEPLVRVPRGDQ